MYKHIVSIHILLSIYWIFVLFILLPWYANVDVESTLNFGTWDFFQNSNESIVKTVPNNDEMQSDYSTSSWQELTEEEIPYNQTYQEDNITILNGLFLWDDEYILLDENEQTSSGGHSNQFMENSSQGHSWKIENDKNDLLYENNKDTEESENHQEDKEINFDDQVNDSNYENHANEMYSYWDIVIKEIYPFDNDFFTAYILIHSHIEYVWMLTIQWLWRGQASRVVDISLQPWDTYLLSDNPLYDQWNTNHIHFPMISLTNTWQRVALLAYDNTLLYERVYSQSDFPTIHPLSSPEDACSLTVDEIWWSYNVWYCNHKYISHTWAFSWSILSDDCSFAIPSHPVTYTQNIWLFEMCSIELIPIFVLSPPNDNQHALTGLFISEIYARTDEMWPEYLELYCEESCVWSVEIVWLGRWSLSRWVDIKLGAHDYLVLTAHTDRFPRYINTQHVQWLSLTDWWQTVTILWQDWQVLDSVVYIGSSNFTSFYRNLTAWPPTPWFYEWLCEELFPEEEDMSIPTCGFLLQHNNPIAHPNRINYALTVNWRMIQNSQHAYTCIRETDAPIEVWVLESCNPTFIWVNEWWVYSVSVTIYHHDDLLCSLSHSLNFPWAIPQTKQQSTHNDQYRSLYQQWKGKYDDIVKKLKTLWISLDLSWEIIEDDKNILWESIVTSVDWLYILWLLPDPVWRDDKEEIFLINRSDQIITTSLFLERNNRRSSLWEQSVYPWEMVTLVWSFGLINRPACVSLVSSTQIFDTFCYGQVTEWEYIFDRIEPAWNQVIIPWISDFTLRNTGTHVCIMYNWQEVTCLPILITRQELTALRRQANRVETLENRLARQQTRIAQVSNDLWILRITLRSLRNEKNAELSLHKELIHLWRNYMLDEFPELYHAQWFAEMYSAYRRLLDSPDFVAYLWSIAVRTVHSLFLFTNWIIPLDWYDITHIGQALVAEAWDILYSFITSQ